MTVNTISAMQAEITANLPSANPAALTAAALRGVLADMTSLLGLDLSGPVTQAASTYTVGASDYSIIANASGTLTLTLPAAASFTGRSLQIKTIAAFTVVSATSNVVPLAGGAAGTAILAGTAGRWAFLQSDGTNWVIMAGN